MIPSKTSILTALVLYLVGAATGASAGVSVLNGLTHEQAASIGESYGGEVLVANNSQRATQVRIYQTDYRFDATGAVAYDEIGSVPRSSGRWVTLGSPGILTLGAGEKTAIPFTITVPTAQDLTGTYWSMLMVEEVPPLVLAEDVADQSLAIRNVFRYAIQLITHIGDSGEEDFRVAGMKLEAHDAEHLGLLHVDLENVGDKLLRADLRIEVFDREGRPAGVFLSNPKRLYPTTSGRFTADLTKVPQGSYKLLMMVRMASGSVYASEYELEPST